MSSLEDRVNFNDTSLVEPLTFGTFYQSDRDFGQSPPSAHSSLHRTSSSSASVRSKRSFQDPFSYRKIGPAIVLKSYQPKSSSLDSASSEIETLEDSAPSGNYDKYCFGAPADSIYAEPGLVDSDHYSSVDDEQMTPLLQFDQDSFDTQVEQSYRTAVTTTSSSPLAHANDLFHSSDVEPTGLTNQSQPIDQLDLLFDYDAPFVASSRSQHLTDSSVYKLIPPLIPESCTGAGFSGPLLLDCLMEPAASEDILPSEHNPGSILSDLSTAPSDHTSTPTSLTEAQNSFMSLGHDDEAPKDTIMKDSGSTGEDIQAKPTPSVSSFNDTLNDPASDPDSRSSGAEEHKTLAATFSEKSQRDSSPSIGVGPINSQSEAASKTDDQVTIESTVVQSSRPTSEVNPSTCQITPENRAGNLTLEQTDRPSKPTSAMNDLEASVHAPSIKSIHEAPTSDPSLVASLDNDPPIVTVADNDPPLVAAVHNELATTSPKPEVIGQDDLTHRTGTDLPSGDILMSSGQPAEPIETSEPTAKEAIVNRQPFPTIESGEDNLADDPAEQRASIHTFPAIADPTSRDDVVPESGKVATLMMDKEPSNGSTGQTQPMSSKQARRIRSVSGFFKTLNKKQNARADALNSPGSESIQSSEEEKISPTAKSLPKKMSLSSLKVKARFSSLYHRSTDESVPTLRNVMEPPRISEEEREVIVTVDGQTPAVKESEAQSSPTPPTQPDQQQSSQATRATDRVISSAEVKASKIIQQYKMSKAKRAFRSRSQTIVPPRPSSVDNLHKPFTSMVDEIGSTPFFRPKTLRKKRTFNRDPPTPVLKDLTLSGLISKIMRRTNQKPSAA